MDNLLRKRLEKFFQIAAVCLLSFLITAQLLQANKIPSLGVWGIFHYYIGAKYINQLGYFDIYSCAIDTTPYWPKDSFIRDLHFYNFVPQTKVQKCDQGKFTKEQWNSFVKDTTFIMNYAPLDYWTLVFTDKGFNPPPSWAAIVSIPINLIPLNKGTYYFLFNLDLLFILVAGFIINKELGKNAALTTLVLAFLYFGTYLIIGNNFIQYAWYPCLVATIFFWRKNKPSFSGMALGIATALQAFPLLFAVPNLFLLVKALLQRDKKELSKNFFFLMTFGLIIFLFFILGSFYGKSIQIWQQWYEKINIQRDYIPGEMFNIGLSNLEGLLISPDHTSSYSYISDYPHTINRIHSLRKYTQILQTISIILTLFVFWIVSLSKRNQPFIYGFFFLYLFVSLSPYYYLSLTLIPYVLWNNSAYVKKYAIYGMFTLFFIHFLLFNGGNYVSFAYYPQLISKLSILCYFIGLAFVLLKENFANKIR